jgi:PhnB protein
MECSVHLVFAGRCEEAFRFYERALDGKIVTMLSYGPAATDVAAEWRHAIVHALADGGSVRMPLQKTFWSPAFGVVVDRFAVPWEISAKA